MTFELIEISIVFFFYNYSVISFSIFNFFKMIYLYKRQNDTEKFMDKEVLYLLTFALNGYDNCDWYRLAPGTQVFHVSGRDSSTRAALTAFSGALAKKRN